MFLKKNSENLTFPLVTKFRMHTSKQMNIYLHVTSHPIIEDSNNIKFAPYTLSIPGLDEMFEVNILTLFLEFI